ncbi:hypothetical protein PACTADRAFT_48917 [Pachysolen tannophilus NRRL Y-2460]|uniref:Protein URE2 n=1 Tax=Pachysolen tannophilus NRRL Y-2460 TaxID=669874 RepID=A0A1E4TZK2_PACTA|nr:hypothetical protein PACTADRAFT_48917 [Pachysolen tannophilus NRRL Y-2460]
MQNSQQTISHLSAGLRSVSLNDNNNSSDGSQNQQGQQQQAQLQQQQQQSQQQQQGQQQQQQQDIIIPETSSRISRFFQNQPTEGFTLFSHRSAPNGFKVAIILSELNYNYNTLFLDFNKGEQRAPEFVTINPNARVPALIDHSNNNLSIWESGAIILYLCSKYLAENGECEIWSSDINEQAKINSFLFYQVSGHATMMGQALHFRYFHSQSVPSAVERYTDEVRRVYGVIEMALAERREAVIMELDSENAAAYSAGTTPLSQSRYFDYPVWLVGDRATIADLSFVPWNNVVDRIGINLKVEYPEVYKWTKHMMRRPAVVRALRGED